MIIIIVILVAFVNKAGELGLNKFLWGAIGLGAYFGTQFLIGILLGLFMDFESLILDETNELALNFAGIIIGGITALVAYRQMPNYATKEKDDISDLLDDDIFR